MASHLVTVAKATFAASLLRPDITKVNRDEVPHFHSLLEAAMQKCSPSNIQTCKEWLMTHIVPSGPRSNAFLKYAMVIARDAHIAEDAPTRTSVQRQRLHLLYLLHDILHATRHHARDATMQSNITQACQPSLVELFRLATLESRSRTQQRLHDLIDLWDAEHFFSKELLNQLRQTLANPTHGGSKSEATASQPTSIARDTPYIMPASHGDPTLPFYELPAGNLMPHVHPNKTIPMQPESIRPLQFSAGPADESLVNAVKDFLKDVADMDDTFQRLDDEGIVPDIDDLGQLSYRNEAGDLVGDTYYGWSRSFCDKMKARRKGPADGAGRHGRDRSRGWSSRSQSSSRSRSPRKRQRYDSRSRSSSRNGNGRSRGFRAPPPGRRGNSLSASPPPRFGFRANPEGNPPSASTQQNLPQFPPPVPPPPPPAVAAMDPRFAHLPPPQFGPNGLPVPPPRPPNWSGPWPPPPPPPGPPNFDARRGFPPYGRGGGPR